MIDLRRNIGLLIDKQFSPRIMIMHGTSVQQYIVRTNTPAQCVLVSDVIHHIPLPERPAFLADLRSRQSRIG
jgi:hypothetical protein